MIDARSRRSFGLGVLVAAATLSASTICATTSRVTFDRVIVQPLADGAWYITDGDESLFAYGDSTASFVAGVLKPALCERVNQVLAAAHLGSIKYAVVMEGASSLAYGDAGLTRGGAVTFAHENLRWRLSEAGVHTDSSLSSGRSASNVQLPTFGFSHVIQLWLGQQDIHFIRERAGFTDADVIIHAEKLGIVYLGNSYSSNGYPRILLDRGGTVAGLIDAAEYFVREFEKYPAKVRWILPGRGPAGTLADLRQYADMLVATNHRVREMVVRKVTLDDTLARRPTAEFDDHWGHGTVSPEEYVRQLYEWNKHDIELHK